MEEEWEAPTPDGAWELYDEVQDRLQQLRRAIAPSARISRSAEIVGQVVIQADAVIMPHTYVRGPAIIGRAAVLGHGAMVRPGTVLGNNTLLGNSCYANAALMGAASRLGHFCGVSRSVLHAGAYFSAFVMTATTRPDYGLVQIGDSEEIEKRGCIVGGRTTIAPHVIVPRGLTIGRECFVGSYVRLVHDLPPKTRATVDSALRIMPNTIETSPRRPTELPDFPTISE
jgi:UDP-N-acetylglucosamine diphosphorylase / glucose-1-phosphate thymidylyltransferase / UDP-N-acetylgalactosamine diphosphorylase / glucosamine-1-phosphate N-acetyltransferase / galactosamine-1-phosphate N-acetyltransferase